MFKAITLLVLFAVALAVTAVVACALPQGATPTAMPPSPTPIPATPTPLPTISLETIDVWEYLPTGAEIVDTVQADVDQDGTPELIVLFQIKERDFPREAKALVFRQTPGGVAAHFLKGNLGDVAIGVTVRDVNKDGRLEIVVSGGAGAHYSLLNIYRWQEGTYLAIGEFGGDAGAGLEDQDGDGVDEVVEGHRWYDRSQIFEDVTYRWSPQEDRYLEVANRLGFTFGAPIPHQYPEQTVLAYYLAIDGGNYNEAYSYLAPRFQADLPFEEFRAGFATTRRVDVNKLEVRDGEVIPATVAVEFTAWDEVNEELVQTKFAGTWSVDRHAGRWELAEAEIAPKE